jgi:hypothetical protein
MLTGTFVETPSDIHVARRQLLLASDRAIEGAPQVCSSDVSSLPAQLRGVLGEVLRASGALCVQLDEPLPPARFAELGRMLGTPLPETDPAVQRYVDDAIILNLLSEHRDTEDVSLQPFATNALTLHSESSGRPTAEQPRYIVLSCREPGLAAASAQTVLVPMQRVEQQLGSDVLLTLSQTRYQSSRALPTIVRNCAGRSVFSFRDFLGQPLEWTCIRPGVTAASVNESLRRLLAAMYTPTAAQAVHWSRGLLVIIDNTFFFHGRTSSAGGAAGPRRHLQRLRILSP